MQKPQCVWKERRSSLPCVETIWSCEALMSTTRTVLADACISIALIEHGGTAHVSLVGPRTKPFHVSLPTGHKTTTIRLKPGVRLKNFSTKNLINETIDIPVDATSHFRLDGNYLQFPDFHNAELLVEDLAELGYLEYKSPDKTTMHIIHNSSSKSHFRHIKSTTGLSPYQLYQLQRIHQALRLLKQGMPAVEVASELDFVDQSHLIRASRRFLGYTPKHLLNLLQNP